MNLIVIVVVLVVLLFGFVVMFGAPFLPTHKPSTTKALDLLDLKPGQTLVELGSGDGRILREAARRGIYAVGYELNPLLVVWSMLASYKYRKYITVNLGNYWHKKLPRTDGIYVFLLDRYMKKLDNKVVQEISKDVKLVSYAFEIPGRKCLKTDGALRLYKYICSNNK